MYFLYFFKMAINLEYLFERANKPAPDPEQELKYSLEEVIRYSVSECEVSIIDELVSDVIKAIKSVAEFGTLEVGDTVDGANLDLEKSLEDIYTGGEEESRTGISEIFAKEIAKFIENLLLSDRKCLIEIG